MKLSFILCQELATQETNGVGDKDGDPNKEALDNNCAGYNVSQ